MKTPFVSRRQFNRLAMLTGAASALSGLAVPCFATEGELFARQGKSILKLHYNENSLGMSPAAIRTAAEAITHSGNRYPDEELEKLQAVLAKQHQVTPDQILVGAGSSEVIAAVVRFAALGGALFLEPVPTFGGARNVALNCGMAYQSVPVGSDFVTDIARLRYKAEQHKGPVLINLCNPNNPTGTIVEQGALEKWISEAPQEYLFLLDEAYFDYAQLNPGYRSCLELIQKGKDNLIVTRTFSKIYGMAGMRIGYGIASKKTARQLRPFADGLNLSIAGISAAFASLQDQGFYQTSLDSNKQAKHILLQTLKQLDLQYIPSSTNFVLHKITGTLQEYKLRMAQNHIWVGRRMTQEDGWNRISLGTPDEMKQFTLVLKMFRDKGWV